MFHAHLSTAFPCLTPCGHSQTVVSQSALFVSFSEEVFARAHDFLPDRWLQPGSNALESWLVVFSKGPRSCLGIK